ncbi:MAG TPA: hypothetical protein VGQ83_09065 [Polyangia bacterium]|jgi:hypothetical protein
MKMYEPRQVFVSQIEQCLATWRMGGHVTRGTQFTYKVEDDNCERDRRWEFVVRVPRAGSSDVIIQPRAVPNRKAWAGLDRRSIVFVRATKHPHRSKLYCKINVADPTGEQTKVGMHRGERTLLPKWFAYFRPHMRLKDTVTTTEGNDQRAQVVLVDPDDHERMIRLFFALKIWILLEGVDLKEERGQAS